jgi:hypothetical protein
MSKEDRAIIKKIYINEEIKIPLEMTYLEHAVKQVNSNAAFVIVASIADSVVSSINKEKLYETMYRRSIFIFDIVYQAFLKEVPLRNDFTMVSKKEEADAILNIHVLQYGYIPDGTSTNIQPIVELKCELQDPTDKILWKSEEKYPRLFLFIDSKKNPSIKIPPEHASNVVNNHKLIIEHFTLASEQATKDILETLDDEN